MARKSSQRALDGLMSYDRRFRVGDLVRVNVEVLKEGACCAGCLYRVVFLWSNQCRLVATGPACNSATVVSNPEISLVWAHGT